MRLKKMSFETNLMITIDFMILKLTRMRAYVYTTLN